jgi:hypothetical protein
MDPFLERPDFFADLHTGLLFLLEQALQTHLPEPYFATTGTRIWVEVTRRFIGPDVNVLRSATNAPTEPAAGAGVAVAEPRTKPVVVHVPHDERVETFVEIYHRDKRERLVTTIEILSPANKTPGEQGYELYARKQKEILQSKANLVEIDLLRGGRHTTAVPRERAVEAAGPFDYHVCIHRFDNLEDFFVYPILLEEPLPEVSLPLLPGDPAVVLGLQPLFDQAYDAGPYRRRVAYEELDIVPPLPPEKMAWVTQRLREKGKLANG